MIMQKAGRVLSCPLLFHGRGITIASDLSVKEVQYLAGHATPDVTMRIYSHYRKEQQFSETAARMAQVSELITVSS